MKDKLSILLTELVAALILTTLWFPTLWIVNYPVEEWIGVVVIGYVSFTAARLIVVNLTFVLTSWLKNHAVRLGDQLGTDIESRRIDRPVAILVTVILVMIATVFGLTFTIMNLAFSLTELTPMGFVFNIIAFVLLGVGLSIQVLFFAGSYLLFRLAEDIIKQPDEWIQSHQNITKLLVFLHRISRRDAYFGLRVVQ